MSVYLIFHFISDYFGLPQRQNLVVVTNKGDIKKIVDEYKKIGMFEKSEFITEYERTIGYQLNSLKLPKCYWSFETLALITNQEQTKKG